MSEVAFRKTSELRQHPVSLEIYGETEDVSDIVPSIREHGIITPLTIKPDGTILSGHRRYRAACEIGLEEVPCVVVDIQTLEEEEIFIVEANKTRVKTASQLLREGNRLKAALEAIARKNSVSNLKRGLYFSENITDSEELESHSSGSGRKAKRIKNPTRVAVADTLGIKEHVWQSLTYIEKLANIGNDTAIEALAQLDSGKITITKAVTMVRNAVRGEDGEDEEPEREPTFLETCLAEAEKHTEALRAIMSKVLAVPDDEFNSAMWMPFSEDIGHIADCSRELDDKIDRKTIKVMREIKNDPAKQAAFENFEMREENMK